MGVLFDTAEALWNGATDTYAHHPFAPPCGLEAASAACACGVDLASDRPAKGRLIQAQSERGRVAAQTAAGVQPAAGTPGP